ncbi:hypothetical protein Chor_016488 [Crotalus horridus]
MNESQRNGEDRKPSLKNDEESAKSDVQKLLELGQKQREEMKSLQDTFQKQLNEATEKAEKQQATVSDFLLLFSSVFPCPLLCKFFRDTFTNGYGQA